MDLCLGLRIVLEASGARPYSFHCSRLMHSTHTCAYNIGNGAPNYTLSFDCTDCSKAVNLSARNRFIVQGIGGSFESWGAM